MIDTYQNYGHLKRYETLGETYRIEAHVQDTDYIVIAPHGGGIEVGTSELARAVAGSEFSLYLFEGLKSSNNATLHITSTNFDEPIARQTVPEHFYGVGLHGMKGDELVTLVGGGNESLRKEAVVLLRAYGFNAEEAPEGHELAGRDPMNIANMTMYSGVQLELSTAQRKAFFEGGDWSKANRGNTTQAFSDYVTALREIMY